jgi:hypothetical protein
MLSDKWKKSEFFKRDMFVFYAPKVFAGGFTYHDHPQSLN